MSYQIKQSSTAYPLLFRMVQTSDHLSALIGASPTVTLSKNGGAFGAVTGAITEISSGWYKVAGNATDSATLGPLLLHATAASGDPVDVSFEVVAFDPQDGVGLGLSRIDEAITTRATPAQVNTEADTALSDYGALKPTTAGRTLDVTAGGEAGIDLANIGSPSTTVNLSGTTIKTATDVEADTANIQTRLPAALVTGRMDSDISSQFDDVADAVWQETAGDHLDAATMGNLANRISTASSTYTGTQTQNLPLTLYRGDDYYVTDNRVIEISESATPRYQYPPVLTGATIHFSVKKDDGTWADGGTVTIINPDVVGTRKLRATPTAAQTILFDKGIHAYQFGGALASGHLVTLEDGQATVKMRSTVS